MTFKTDLLINHILYQLKEDGVLESEFKRLGIQTTNISNLTSSDKNKILESLSVMS